MASRKRFRPSGSMVVALAALVLAMTGSAVAGSLITSKQIKDGTIQVKDISKSARKSLKGSRGATGPQGPQGPKGDPGQPATVAPDEGWHEIGAPGEPAFENGWVNFGPADATAGFYRDARGIVHLKGTIKNGTVATAFTLPPGYRPAVTHLFASAGSGVSPYVAVDADGSVRLVPPVQSYASLEPIEFRLGS
jgi:hypothetical protein